MGKRGPKKNVLMMARIEELMIEGRGTTEITGVLALEHADLGVRRAPTMRTVERYQADIRDKWQKRSAARIEDKRDEHRAKLEQLRLRAMELEQLNAAASALKQLAKLDGLDEPIRITGTVGMVPVMALSPAQRRAEIERLMAERVAGELGEGEDSVE